MDEPPSRNAPTRDDEARYERDRIAWNLPSARPPASILQGTSADEPDAAERRDLKPTA